MKNKLGFLVGVVVVAVLAAYMFTFQVRYDEVAVLTTMGRAGEGGVKSEPGLYFQFPTPIQSVEKYSKKLQILDDEIEEKQTADGHSVIIRKYVTWRIDDRDPAKFYTSVKKIADAPKRLQPMLRQLNNKVGNYRFDQFVNSDPNKLALQKFEEEALKEMQSQTAAYGIKVEHVGIRRVVLPEPVTQKVFTRMTETRKRMAENASSAGRAQATAIRSEATTAEATIKAFAQSRAAAIKAEGVSQAAVYMDAFKKDEGFAIFLRQVDTLKTILAHNTTFVLDSKSMAPLELFDTKSRASAGK